MNTENYVVHAGFIYLEDEWDNSYDGQRYDDVLRCTVNLDHPLFNPDTLDVDLECYWSTGLKPIYVL